MKSLRRLTFFVGLITSAPWAAAEPVVEHPLTADVYQEMLRFRMAHHGASLDDVSWGTSVLLSKIASDPTSPYSDTIDKPVFTNEIWWPRFVRQVGDGHADPFHATIASLRWQKGLTKARIGIDVNVTDLDTKLFGGQEAAASALKAGLSPDIFWKARDRNPSRLTFAAREAVAMQILREQMQRVPRERWPALAIHEDVFKRYMSRNFAYGAFESDRTYLSSILDMALRTGEMSVTANGTQQLPAALRVARAAAAYKDALGYFGAPYCNGNEPARGMPRDASAFHDNRPLCFIAATDRGVHRWYRYEARLEYSGKPIHENPHRGWADVKTWLSGAMALLDVAMMAEFSEALMGDGMYEAEALGSTEVEASDQNLSQLMCGVRRP